MNIVKTILLSFGIMVPGLALAHAHLEASVPAANSTVPVMPPEITLHFSEAIRVTALSIERDGAKEMQDIKAPAETKAVLKVSAPKLAAGSYVLKWRGLGDDGHIMSGTVRFAVSGK